MSKFAKFGSILLNIDRFVGTKSNLTGQAFLSACANILKNVRAEINDIQIFVSKGEISQKYDMNVTSLIWLEQKIANILSPITEINKKIQNFKFIDQFESGGNLFSCKLLQFCFECCEEPRVELLTLWKFIFVYTFEPFLTMISNMFKTGIVDPFDEFLLGSCESNTVQGNNKWDQIFKRNCPDFLDVFIDDLLVSYKSVLVLNIMVNFSLISTPRKFHCGINF